MIINLNEFGGGGQVSPEEIEKIVNENHYTKEESDAIVNDVKDIADDAKAIAESKADVDMVDAVKVIADDAKTIAESKADVAMVDEAKAVADEAKAIAESKADVAMVDEAKAIADEAKTIADSKQDALVSGTNIKTINGEDILGEGDIEIKGGDTNPCFVHLVFTDGTERIDYLTKNYVPTSAYTDNTTIQKVLVGDGIKKIVSYAFKGCTNLSAIILPDTLESIGDYAFSYTNANDNFSVTVGKTINNSAASPLSGFTFPNSLIEIGDYAFSGKKTNRDVEINIGTNLKRIGDNAFSGFGNIIRITTPENDVKEHSKYGEGTIFLQNVTSIGSGAFNGVLGEKFATTYYSASLHLSVTTSYGGGFFPNNVFTNNKGLKYVYIGRDEKNYMGGNTSFNFCENMFSGCTNLNYIWINPMVTSITVKSDAFRDCSSTGTLYCSKEAYDSITSKSDLGPVANWTVKFIETDSNKISTLGTDVAQLKEDIKDIENRIVILTQEEYEALETKGENTIYLIK